MNNTSFKIVLTWKKVFKLTFLRYFLLVFNVHLVYQNILVYAGK